MSFSSPSIYKTEWNMSLAKYKLFGKRNGPGLKVGRLGPLFQKVYNNRECAPAFLTFWLLFSYKKKKKVILQQELPFFFFLSAS